jgi:hypothetical protein
MRWGEDLHTNTEADAARYEARRGWCEEFRSPPDDPHYDHLDDIDYYDDEWMDEGKLDDE